MQSDENSASVTAKETLIREIYAEGEWSELTYLSFFITEESVTELDAIDYYGNELRLTVKEDLG